MLEQQHAPKFHLASAPSPHINPFSFTNGAIQNLLITDIAAIWDSRVTLDATADFALTLIAGYSGRIITIRAGPGTRKWLVHRLPVKIIARNDE